MAAGILPAPGTKYGPCEGGCDHRDCEATRREAEEPCRICGERIGYETRFYKEYTGLVHALCLEKIYERRKE